MRDALNQAISIIEGALAEGGRACLTCSFQAEDVVVLHLLRQRLPKVPVMFLETGYHFPEVLAYRDQLTRDWKLNTLNLQHAKPTLHPDTPSW